MKGSQRGAFLIYALSVINLGYKIEKLRFAIFDRSNDYGERYSYSH